MVGYVHSFDSFGTVDGPGIRLVVFLQGCPMRCAYCHNPDTWSPIGGEEVTPEDVLARYRKNKTFYSRGGITVTGGEPLMQTAFVTELFTLAKENGIHTCLDTSGILFVPDRPGREAMDRLMAVTDLVLLDIKHIDPMHHERLTGHGNETVLAFAEYLDKRGIPVWVRHVLVPGHTDDPQMLLALGQFIGSLSSVKAFDLLPYHTMGVDKYKQLNMEYPLASVVPPSKEETATARRYVLEGIRQARKGN